MKRSEVKLGVRVRQTDPDAYSYDHVGTIIDTDMRIGLIWINFDIDSANNTHDAHNGYNATACDVSTLEVVQNVALS